MLAAVLGHLVPRCGRTWPTARWTPSGRVGHLEDDPSVMDFLERRTIRRLPRIWPRPARPGTGQRQAASPAICRSRAIRGGGSRQLVQAYVLAQPSKGVEGRACWNHSGTGAYEGDWDRTAKELAENGFNMVLPNMLWGGLAHYPSDVLPRSADVRETRRSDRPMPRRGQEVRTASARLESELQPGHSPQGVRREDPQRAPQPGVGQRSGGELALPVASGELPAGTGQLLEVARKYEVDGLHFDYIRYPDHDKCYCEGCRARFEQQTGAQVAHWPADCYSGTCTTRMRSGVVTRSRDS